MEHEAVALTPEQLAALETEFLSRPENRVAMNAVTSAGFLAAATDRRIASTRNHTFSHLVRTPAVTNQKQSGRCWLFAGLNLLRLEARDSLGLDQFELSQNYLAFFDKMEKANFFLANIVSTAGEPVDGRLVSWLLADPVPDAGQWDMFTALVKKYGVVPKSVMPETWHSGRTRSMNELLAERLRFAASQIRERVARQAASRDVNTVIDRALADVYRILATHLGIPPRDFAWEWRDAKGAFFRDGILTPRQFYQKHCQRDLEEYQCLIHAPGPGRPFDTAYTVEYLGNVVGGPPVLYINLEVDILKKAAIDSIVSGEPVWFGCDVGKALHRELGMLDIELFEHALRATDTSVFTKADRLTYGHSKMTHAMLLTGVDLDEHGTPVQWRVENSWGDKVGDKGFLVMSDRWFTEHVYEVVVHRRLLEPAICAIAETQPVALPPWDPMGALA
ncbi:MAG: C1 family peptidase [Spirochaetaceae bacterium]